MNIFKSKNYVISGSSRGIGLSIANIILENGGNILITGRDEEQLNKIYLRLKKKYKNVVILKQYGDLLNSDTYVKINKLLKKEKWTKISGIVANAGQVDSKKNKANQQDISWHLNANFFLSVNFVNNFLDNYNCKSSSIIFISSIASNLHIRSPFGYSSGKILLNHYSKYLSMSLHNQDIKVNTISPGNIFFRDGNWDIKLKKNKKKINNYIKKNVPLNRFGKPDEIASIVYFLFSGKSDFINGSNISCDGGQI